MPTLLMPESWANDGKNLIASKSIPGIANSNLGILSLEDDQWEPLLEEEYGESNPRISPNGLWMAYTSNESGFNEVYICSFPKVNQERKQISTNGGDNPIWSPDGRELFYRNGSELMAVTVEPGRSLEVGKPRSLFQGTYQAGWDIHPNGKKFLMIKPSVTSIDKSTSVVPRPKINVVLNWFEELKERVLVE